MPELLCLRLQMINMGPYLIFLIYFVLFMISSEISYFYFLHIF